MLWYSVCSPWCGYQAVGLFYSPFLLQSRAQELGKEAETRAKQKWEFKQKNLHADQDRPDESFLAKLDGSVKKNSAFVKKLVGRIAS